jgi:uncharacterized protein (TIGR02246 family)
MPLAIAMVLLLVASCRPAEPRSSAALTDTDRAAIRALDTAFVQAWLRDDTTAVLQLFHPDAILFPPGAEPVEGLRAIRGYWWPTDGSHTRITSFTRRVQEIEGSRELAYFRGTAMLGWVYKKAGKATAQTSRSTDLVLVTPDPRGRWLISRQMWVPRP